MPSPLASLARPTAPGAIRLAQLARLFSEEEEQLSKEKALHPRGRSALFRESWPQSLRRQALAMAYAVQPRRIGELPPMLALLLREALAPSPALPDANAALARPEGLCGVARDLSVATLIDAYASGLYPWCHAGPVKWWAPRTRCVGDPRQIRFGEATRRHGRRGTFKFTFDRDFDRVIVACAAPRPGQVPLTWITPKIMRAYAALHRAGFAHSYEVWDARGELVAGGYGVASGRVFVGESMFTRVSGAGAFGLAVAHSYEVWDARGELVAGGYGVASGRIFVGESMFTRVSGAGAFGLAVLHRHLAHWGFDLHDAKLPSPHLCSLGFTQMAREQYATYLSRPLAASRPGHWQSVSALSRLP